MALAANSLPTELTFAIEDFNGEESSTSVFVPPGASLTDLAVNVGAYELVLAALSDGFIKGGGLSRRFNQLDPRPNFDVNRTSNVQRKGVFIFENSFGTYNAYAIPSIDRSLVLPNSDRINQADPAVAAYVALMTSAALAVLPGVRPIGGNGYQLVRLVDAYEDTVSRPNRKR